MPDKIEKEIGDRQQALADITEALRPCYEDPPKASAVIIINSGGGTCLLSLNMDWLERVGTLQAVANHLVHEACAPNESGAVH